MARQARAKTGHSAETILEVAREILALEGYPSLTIRNIAKRAGVSIGNVQYYFQTKDVLVQELLHSINAQSERAYEHMCATAPQTPAEKFNAFLDFALTNMLDPLHRGLFFQSWAMATSNEHIEQCKEQSVTFLLSALSDLILDLMPRLDDVERHTRASAILALLEGAQLGLIQKEDRFAHPPGMRALIKAEAHDIAMQPPE